MNKTYILGSVLLSFSLMFSGVGTEKAEAHNKYDVHINFTESLTSIKGALTELKAGFKATEKRLKDWKLHNPSGFQQAFSGALKSQMGKDLSLPAMGELTLDPSELESTVAPVTPIIPSEGLPTLPEEVEKPDIAPPSLDVPSAPEDLKKWMSSGESKLKK